jgi:predicted dehydrogenase
VKILIVGLGSVGQRHARNLRALLGESVDLITYRTRGLPHVITEQMTVDEGRVEERYGIRAHANQAAALCEQPAATIVCNPSSLHLGVARAALEAGSHVLIEKPLSHTWDGVESLIELADRRQLVAAVAYQMRFHPALHRVRESLCRRAIGELRSVRSVWHEYLPDAHPYEDYRQSYAARDELGGGVLRCFIHEFDYLYSLFGLPVEVSTTGGNTGALAIDVEDTAQTRMQYVIDGRSVPIEVDLSFSSRERIRTLDITGEDGSIHADFDEPLPGFDRNRLFVDELRDFLSAIADNHAPAVPIRHGAQSLRMALAARESLRSGRTVKLQ